jgi:hypothetical protein
MTKKEILKAIEKMYEDHILEMEQVKLLIDGKRVKNLPPVKKEECEFGKWLYGDAQKIKVILGLQIYSTMEIIHEYWHLMYAKIYDLYYLDNESMLKKVFFLHRRLSKEEAKEAREYYAALEKASTDLLEELNTATRRVLALKERMFTQFD